MLQVAPNIINLNNKELKATNKLDVYTRRKILHDLLGQRCYDCGGKRKRYDMHHEIYLYGFNEQWTKYWKNCSDRRFYRDVIREVRECCVLLCRKCHKKRHGLLKQK